MEKKVKDEKSKRVSSIGGQALLEGVMMRGPSCMALAVKDPSGQVLLETQRFKKKARRYKKIPILRGLIAFFDSLISGVNTLTKSAEVSSPDEEVLSKGWMGFAVFLGLALGVGLFILLPNFLSSLLFDVWLDIEHMVLLSSLLEGILRITIFVLYLFLVSRLKDIRRTFMYHGAEHKTINAYEKGLELTVSNVQTCSTRHNRCGTTFLFFVMLVSILLFSLANYIFLKLGISSDNYGQVANIFIKMGIRLALLPFVAGISYELLKGLASLPDNFIVNILRSPGLALQRLTTLQPDDGMVEVALKSFNAVLEMEADESILEVKFDKIPLKTAKEFIISELKGTNADLSEPDWILCDVLKVRRNALRETKFIDLKQFSKVKTIVSRRKNCEPLWYILGYTDFFAQRLIVNNNALIPRSETELLCERAIEYVGNKELKVLDLCTGSGCIALAIAKNTNAVVTACDISDKALTVAAQNLKDRAELKVSDMFSAFDSGGIKFDLIVSNPPYIKTADIESLDAEVKGYEPLLALDGGADGLRFYRSIAQNAPEFLTDKGMVMLEIGSAQGEDVKNLLSEAFTDINVIKDYAGHDRIVTAVKK